MQLTAVGSNNNASHTHLESVIMRTGEKFVWSSPMALTALRTKLSVMSAKSTVSHTSPSD